MYRIQNVPKRCESAAMCFRCGFATDVHKATKNLQKLCRVSGVENTRNSSTKFKRNLRLSTQILQCRHILFDDSPMLLCVDPCANIG